MLERVAEHDREFEQHDVQLALVGVNAHVLFVIVLDVVEREFRNVLKPPCTRAPRKTDCEKPSLRCLLISERDVVWVLYLAYALA